MTTPIPAEYAKLPVSIKAIYTVQEWLWLPDWKKALIETIETQPDIYPDS